MDKVHLIATDSHQPSEVNNANTVEYKPTKPMKRSRKKTGCLITMLFLTALLLASTITFAVLVSDSWATYAAFHRNDYDGYGGSSYTVNEIKQKIRNLQQAGNNDVTLNNIYKQLSSQLNRGSFCTSAKTVEDQLLQSDQWESLASDVLSHCFFKDYINGNCIQDTFMQEYNSNNNGY